MPTWKKYKLSDVLELFGGGTPKTSIPEYWNGNIPWLSVVDFGGGRKYVSTTEKSITEEGFNNCSSKLLRAGQIIISARGTVGAMAMLKHDMAFNQSCYGITAKEGLVTNDFLYYLLRFNLSSIKNFTHGSVFDTITRNTFDQVTVEIPPDLPTQTRIASILSALDDKIELNRQMNQTLEQMAQALFKKYFVDDIDPDNLPEGWDLQSLDQVAEYLNGLALQKFPAKDDECSLPAIKIRELSQGITSATDKVGLNIPSQYIIEDGDVIFSWSGTLKVVLWCGGQGALNQHLFKVTSTKYPKWFYYYWTLHHLNAFIAIAAGKATTMGHIQRQHLKDAKVFVPKYDYIRQYDKIFAQLIDRIILNNVESRNLQITRDTLLPKLMSGEIEVNTKLADEILS